MIKRNVIVSGKLDAHIAYPTHVCVPLGRGEISGGIEKTCGLLADGEPILSQVETVQHWPDGSPKWQHVWANLRAGIKYEYYAGNAYDSAGVSALRVEEDYQKVQVDNGIISVTIEKAPHAGRVTIQDSNSAEVHAIGSHFLIDERSITFSVQNDPKAKVEIEMAGPQVVCVKVSGWYESSAKRVPVSFCVARAFTFSRIARWSNMTMARHSARI